ncbi:conjugal transfer protein TraX [Streptococcus thermophilus LMD-9]|nr:TraX family protein [Streptococcus thermophilus]UEC17967.1 conjugal transfer protein TraX [Streptococcus thermophilus LMD-9]
MYLCVLDHIHQMFEGMGVPLWLTMLGRLVFPIFLFLAADSFHYTHDRLAYLRRLLYMSWFMTIGNAIILLPILSSIPVVVLAGINEIPHANPLVVQIVASILSLVPSIIMVEGGFVMVILGLLFYIFRTNRIAQIIVLAIISVITHLFDPTTVQWMMIFAVIPMYFYNGERGSGNKNFFYIFYPAHIYLLWILASFFR